VTDKFDEWLNGPSATGTEGATVTILPVRQHTPDDASPYASKALADELDRLLGAGEGTRNDTLNTAAFNLGQLVGAGALTERDVTEQLRTAALAIGLEATETDRTIRSGLAAGAAEPRDVKPWTPKAPRERQSDTTLLVQPAPSPPAANTAGPPTTGTGDGPTAPPESSPDETTDAERAPATWARLDLDSILDGTHVPATPELMPRTDGVCLLYPGLTHSLHGESESGKSWIAQAEAARCIKAGQDVLYVDFESDALSVVERLTLLGCTADAIRRRFDYRQPEVSPANTHELGAWHDMLSRPYALAVIDGVTDAMGIFGRSTNDNDDISAWARVFPKLLASRTGAAVVMIDHVTKDKETRGRFAIGGQAKMASLTGAGYVVDVHDGLGKGLRGTLVLRVAKDRPGSVRGASGPMRKSDRTQEAARFVLDSTGDTLAAEVHPWRDTSAPGAAFRPTHLMEKVSRLLEVSPGASKNAVEDGVTGKRDVVRLALQALVDDGFVNAKRDGSALRHYSVRAFREDAAEGPQTLEIGPEEVSA
jgi:hypothetical protein